MLGLPGRLHSCRTPERIGNATGSDSSGSITEIGMDYESQQIGFESNAATRTSRYTSNHIRSASEKTVPQEPDGEIGNRLRQAWLLGQSPHKRA
ncbi:hypothetical protein [Parasitella parasitica]|uniref:Uncharacterized protein n=1 Tax=Parasitella parasitica TaxID=35722 RepID=A0A0B7MW76_9FUNG|nr:hypothetical protein [Parasitella parasitica]